MTDNSTYDPSFFAPLFEAEDHHFWFRSRNETIAGVFHNIVADLPRSYRALEVGCGTGNVLRVLKASGPHGLVVGMDLFLQSLKFAQRRSNAALIQGDMHSPPFHRPFDIIGLFDVIEHLPNDRGVLNDLYEMLQPGGRLVITVPAYPALWSYFDEASHHCRRYTPDELETKLEQAGFNVEICTPFMMILFPLVWFIRRVSTLRQKTQTSRLDSIRDRATREFHVLPVINSFLLILLRIEAAMFKHSHRLPFGTSIIAVASRPATDAYVR